MVKRGKKRPRPNSEGTFKGWRRVDVGLGKTNTDENDSDDNDFGENHYDNPQLARKAGHDLECDPSEQLGVFLGLEVLDGSQYKLVVDKKTGSKKLLEVVEPSEDHDASEQSETEGKKSDSAVHESEPKDSMSSEKKKKKRKKKKKKKIKSNTDEVQNDKKSPKESGDSNEVKDGTGKVDAANGQSVNDDDVNEEEMLRIQTQWMSASGGNLFHDRLYKSFLKYNWQSPTPIQSAVLPAAILGRRNIVGAAPTGSGKTLVFLLPIYQYLLEQHDIRQQELDDDDDDVTDKRRRNDKQPLQALILTPTRELALQIHTEGEKLWKGQIGTLVGGLAIAKQERVLTKNRPAILTATPGRLWELISSGQYEHLNDMSQLRFLVIDEADRMIQQGSFPQLEKILDTVQSSNPMYDSDDEEANDEADDHDVDDNEDDDRLQGLPGIPGEARVHMLSDDILKQIELVRNEGVDVPKPKSADDEVNDEPDEVDDNQSTESAEEVIANEKQQDDDEDGSDHEYDELDDENDENILEDAALPSRPPVQRQTFVYSATLTLPASIGFKAPIGKKRKRSSHQSVDGAIAEILEKAHVKGKTKVVDLSNMGSSNKTSQGLVRNAKSKTDKKEDNRKSAPKTESHVRLPEGLQFLEIKCTQRHKDSHLYAYLMTTAAGSSGPALIFCNSIAAVRRVGATLQVLGLPVRILHAQMQQRARFKAVESLNRDNTSRTIVVATDVAARGLDIPSVSTVIHYDAARSMDTFIHRSGRTARGIGEGAVGFSLSLLSPDEDKNHAAITGKLHVQFSKVNIDGRLLRSSQERVNLASKIFEAQEKQGKAKRQNQWFLEAAKDAGIDLDDNCLDNGLEDGDQRNASKLREAENARVRLQALLSQPMQTQMFGKFLTTARSVSQDATK